VSAPTRCPYCGGDLAEEYQRELHAAADDLNIAPPDDGMLVAWRRSSARFTRKFVQFHDANPNVYTELVRLARQWAAEHPGRRQSILLHYTRLRCESEATTTGDSYKLPENYKAYYARLIMASEPDLADAFDTRSALADLLVQRDQLSLLDEQEDGRSA
jgi:hypothetical protein